MFFFAATPNGLQIQGHHHNDVVIIINYHHTIVNISRSVQHACTKTANAHDGLSLREIQPVDFPSVRSAIAAQLIKSSHTLRMRINYRYM